MEQFRGPMSEVLMKYPDLDGSSNSMAALNIVYNMAKGQAYQQMSKDPISILQNQNIMEQILSNPENQKQVVTDYLQQVQSGNQAPTVISGQVSGQTPIVPPAKPKNDEEARAMAMEILK